jgi:hypothetical protein
MKQTSLLTKQPAFRSQMGRFSPSQVRMHTGLFEQLPPSATVQKKKQGYTIAYKSEVGFTEKIQNETDDYYIESSLP